MGVQRFHDLIPYRVREILLVSSPYDAFILEEDGRLSEQLYNDFTALDLSAPPRVHQAASSQEALARLKKARFDLILVMSSLADESINGFAHKVRSAYPGKPIVYLALNSRELEAAEEVLDPELVDSTYLWTGDSSVLLGIVKLVEDRDNADHDTAAGVRVILVLEDSPAYYTNFLGLLYEELMTQAKSLYFEGLNELQRKLYIRSRPKILHAKSYEEGRKLYKRYRDSLLALISDVRLPRKGELNAKAGFAFANRARRDLPDLPILFQSAEEENATEARALGGLFVNKNSRDVLTGVKAFLAEHLGFGEFVFRLPDGTEIARASDVGELRKHLVDVPIECVEYHASHDHFSIWLMARSEFELAEQLRPKKISDFENLEALRQHLLLNLERARHRGRSGLVTDFNRKDGEGDHFSRIGEGSIGAKARGLAFLYQRLSQLEERPVATLPVKVPKTVVLTTEIYDRFIDDELVAWAIACEDDDEIAATFTARDLPAEVMADLESHPRRPCPGPLAVRSSSLLEDSAHQPFAGIYATLMIPNCATEPRSSAVAELAKAIRLVYASTFYQRRLRLSVRVRRERRPSARRWPSSSRTWSVGRRGDRFYPTISGVCLTRNFYPIPTSTTGAWCRPSGPRTGSDDRRRRPVFAIQSSASRGSYPRSRRPEVRPQVHPEGVLRRGPRRQGGAVDPMVRCPHLSAQGRRGGRQLWLSSAACSLRATNAWSRTSPFRARRIVSFHNILKHHSLPLVETLTTVDGYFAREGLGREVEIEFAVQMEEGGTQRRLVQPGADRPPGPADDGSSGPWHRLPSGSTYARGPISCASSLSTLRSRQWIVRSRTSIYVKPETWDPSHNRAIAATRSVRSTPH